MGQRGVMNLTHKGEIKIDEHFEAFLKGKDLCLIGH
jgi:hypothetical protein